MVQIGPHLRPLAGVHDIPHLDGLRLHVLRRRAVAVGSECGLACHGLFKAKWMVSGFQGFTAVQ